MHSVRILGVDPGLNTTGWGVIEQRGSALTFIACGTITSRPADALSVRLGHLARGLREVINEHQPRGAAIEETFVNVNGASTLKLGQARGALLLTLADAGLEVGEYAPNLIKKAIVGVGRAEKAQVAMMVQMLLPAAREALTRHKADASDALAVAICHAHHSALQHIHSSSCA
ncbi:MAG: crossover junction endodeoxyribonuclease RuvC [Alphaproteobacteria bacterium]|nr:crossover junction endodeoxyribonuclease RuvC [Alphaproteobacteria bacterium]